MAGNLASPELQDQFESGLRMWVREEQLPDGRNLTEVFNQSRENVRYLPGVKLGDNVTAVPELEARALARALGSGAQSWGIGR